MTTLTVWKFNSASGAEETLAKLSERQKEYVIEIQDAAIVRSNFIYIYLFCRNI